MSDIQPTPEPVPPTQVAHPWHAIRRTVLVVIVTAATLIPLVAQAIDYPGQPQWLTSALGQMILVAGILTRIISIPAVNLWLTSIGLGATPKNSLTKTTWQPQPFKLDNEGIARTYIAAQGYLHAGPRPEHPDPYQKTTPPDIPGDDVIDPDARHTP